MYASILLAKRFGRLPATEVQGNYIRIAADADADAQ